MMRPWRRRRIGALLLAALGAGCAPAAATAVPDTRTAAGVGGVTFISPRCPAAASCLLGQVIAAESANPLVKAAVFLEREEQDSEDGTPIRFLRLTDDQGVFTVVDAPAGRYRIAIYADERKLGANGLVLGAPGTTVVPVRMPPAVAVYQR
jgi:hypothetical protein